MFLHVEFYSKNKFEKLVYLVGFIIRIYHDARSPERQIRVHDNYYTKHNKTQRQTRIHYSSTYLEFHIAWGIKQEMKCNFSTVSQ